MSKRKCTDNCLQLIFWKCFESTGFNCIFLVVVAAAAACSCYSFKLSCSINSKSAIFELYHYRIQWAIYGQPYESTR